MIKNDENHCIKKIKSKFRLLAKFYCILFLKFSFDGVLFFNLYFDVTMTHFLNSHISLYMCDKCSVIISKVHYESIIFLEFMHI
jgi:hypothetical protein